MHLDYCTGGIANGELPPGSGLFEGILAEQEMPLCRYNTYIAHYKELECMRLALEPLLYENGVDIIFAG